MIGRNIDLFRCLFYSFTICVSINNVHAQGVTTKWILGYDSTNMVTSGKTIIDFSSGQPVSSWNYLQMNFGSTNASICDKNGNMLFYTNGVFIANAIGDTMLNGSGLNPSYYTNLYSYEGLFVPQGDVIIPFPSDSNKYYLFHETIDYTFLVFNLYYSVIDMSLNGGLGAVISKNNIYYNNDSIINCCSSVCKHANGRDWWIINHQFNSNRYIKFLVTPFGIQDTLIQDIGKVMNNSGAGQSVFSPDGNKFAMYNTEDDLDLMDFDRCTGNFTNLIHVNINDTAGCAGVAFSPNSQILYLSSFRYVYQFDLTSTNIANSQLTVGTWDGFHSPCSNCATTFYLAQLAPDGKIYINSNNSTDRLHVINYPDSLGFSCDVCQHCLQLPTNNAFSIPNHPNYFLGAEHGSICDSLTSDVSNLSSLEQPINLFPNPSKGILYITKGRIELINSISIYNSIGQEQAVNYTSVKNGEYLELNVSTLSPGIYFLEVMNDKLKVVKKFVKE